MGLLKRNAKERMNFEIFFNHKFLQRDSPSNATPVQGGTSYHKKIKRSKKLVKCLIPELPLPIYGSSPLAKIPLKPSTPIRIATPPRSQPGNERLSRKNPFLVGAYRFFIILFTLLQTKFLGWILMSIFIIIY